MEVDGAGNHATVVTPHEMHVDSADADCDESLPVALLEPLAHMSHRRERHCRVILQHACADAVIPGAASFVRRAAAEAPRIFASGDATEASRSDLRDVAFAGELAALLIHNLAIAASVKEPRDDDDTYLDEPAEKHPALAKDGKYDPMTSVVRHAQWEGLVRDVFAMCEWLAKREGEEPIPRGSVGSTGNGVGGVSSRPRGRRDDGFFPRKRKRKRARRARDSVPRRAGDVHGRVPGSARAGQRSSPAAADGRGGRSCSGCSAAWAPSCRRGTATLRWTRWACSTACCGSGRTRARASAWR